MSLKLVKIEPKFARIALLVAGLFCVIVTWFFVKWNFANAVSSRIDTQKPESKIVADWLTQVAPSDPQTHFASAVVLEKTFDTGDLDRSLAEYEMATALSPNNYFQWLSLAKSRNLNGDTDGAEAALRRATELAPNYAAVQWAYGNLLVRQGKTDEGFSLMAKAATANSDYALPAATTALQILDGDLAAARSALGEDYSIDAALATALANSQRFDEAFEMWSKIAAEQRSSIYKKLGETLVGQMIAAKRFRLASNVSADILPVRPTVGEISNGGFENGVKLSGAFPFEWRIAEGNEPQIGLSDTQKRSGSYGLFIFFNTFNASVFRPVAKMVAVEPGGQYEFEVWYRSDIKSAASLKWEIADAGTTNAIAATTSLAPAAEWTRATVRFTVSAGSDGVIVRLNRDGCTGPACPMTGRISFDDLAIKRL